MRMGREPSTTSQNTSSENEEPEYNPAYKCQRCKDTGMYRGRDSLGRDSMILCPCRKLREAEWQIKASGLEDEIKEKRFDNFECSQPWQQSMKDKAIEFGKEYFAAKDEGRKLPWLYIGGQSGSGKTHLCTAVCGVMLKKGVPVRYMRWATDSRKLRAIRNSPEYDGMFERLCNAEILYIDDLFKQKSHKTINVTEAETYVLFELLNERMMQNKSTIISSEWYLRSEMIEQVDDGTFGRVYQMTGYGRFDISIKRDTENNYRIKSGVKKDEGAD